MEPFVGGDIPIRRTYRCLCGKEAVVVENTIYKVEGNLYSTETTIDFEHPEPIKEFCLFLMEKYKEEQAHILTEMAKRVGQQLEEMLRSRM